MEKEYSTKEHNRTLLPIFQSCKREREKSEMDLECRILCNFVLIPMMVSNLFYLDSPLSSSNCTRNLRNPQIVRKLRLFSPPTLYKHNQEQRPHDTAAFRRSKQESNFQRKQKYFLRFQSLQNRIHSLCKEISLHKL